MKKVFFVVAMLATMVLTGCATTGGFSGEKMYQGVLTNLSSHPLAVTIECQGAFSLGDANSIQVDRLEPGEKLVLDLPHGQATFISHRLDRGPSLGRRYFDAGTIYVDRDGADAISISGPDKTAKTYGWQYTILDRR